MADLGRGPFVQQMKENWIITVSYIVATTRNVKLEDSQEIFTDPRAASPYVHYSFREQTTDAYFPSCCRIFRRNVAENLSLHDTSASHYVGTQ